ncbi:MAG: hypothetical protein IKH56_08515 [Oscillospiraceae bacterium]|nr:hypothetical protein [Oscillospiraceae bacterium]
MAHRAAVSIYLDSEIAEMYMLMDAEPGRSREFILALAMVLDGCRDAQDVRSRLRMPEARPGLFRELQASADDLFIVDLSSRCVYCSPRPIPREELERTRVMDLGRTDAMFAAGLSAVPGLYIPFEAIPAKEIRACDAYWHLRNRRR